MPVFAPSNGKAKDLQVKNTCLALCPNQLFLHCQQHSQLYETMMNQCFKAQLFLQGHIRHPPRQGHGFEIHSIQEPMDEPISSWRNSQPNKFSLFNSLMYRGGLVSYIGRSGAKSAKKRFSISFHPNQDPKIHQGSKVCYR